MHPHTQAFYFLTFVIYVAPYLLELLERCQYYLIGFQRGGWRWKQDENGRRMEMEEKRLSYSTGCFLCLF